MAFVLRQIRALGIKLVFDDFGSGYTSLAQLKYLPIDSIKVDRTLIHGVGQDPCDEAVLRALVNLCQALGLYIVAEGVEQAGQLAWVRQAGFHHAQGYLLGRPAPCTADPVGRALSFGAVGLSLTV